MRRRRVIKTLKDAGFEVGEWPDGDIDVISDNPRLSAGEVGITLDNEKLDVCKNGGAIYEVGANTVRVEVKE